jgi:hypothetical protein
MNTNVYNGLVCTIPLDHTYKLARGKLPEKVIVEPNRYFIPDLNIHTDVQFYTKLNDKYISCIYDVKYNIFLTIKIREHNNKIISKVIDLRTNENKILNQQYYIPIITALRGDPDNIKSISIDHIDRNKMNECVNNLRWADPYIQNNNKSNSLGEYSLDDWIYLYNNKEYENIIELYSFLLNNNLISNTITEKQFKKTLSYSTKRGHKTYGLIITRKLKELNTYGIETWVELKKLFNISSFTHISNYGRLGRIVNNIIIPRTIDNPNSQYSRLKLKYNNKELAIHNLVYYHFKGEIAPNYIVDHIDSNKKNNHISNLRVLTTPQNIKHSMDTNKTHGSTTKVELTNIETNEILKFNSKVLTCNHFNLKYHQLEYKLKRSVNNIIKFNNIQYLIKREIKNNDIRKHIHGKKFNRCDTAGNVLGVFNTITEIEKYYIINNYTFSPKEFNKVVNTDKYYNMPNILWKSVT